MSIKENQTTVSILINIQSGVTRTSLVLQSDSKKALFTRSPIKIMNKVFLNMEKESFMHKT